MTVGVDSMCVGRPQERTALHICGLQRVGRQGQVGHQRLRRFLHLHLASQREAGAALDVNSNPIQYNHSETCTARDAGNF